MSDIRYQFLQVNTAYSSGVLLDDYRVPGYIIFDKTRGTITIVKDETKAPSTEGYKEYGGGIVSVTKDSTKDIYTFTDNCGYSLILDLSPYALKTSLQQLEENFNGMWETITDIANSLNQLEQDVLNPPLYTIEKVKAEEGYSATYKLRKATNTGDTTTTEYVGAAINIPKDMVVSSGDIEKNPEGHPEGTYIVLTLANATNDKLYISVTDLVDTYTGSAYIEVENNTIKLNTIELSKTFVSKARMSTIMGETSSTKVDTIPVYNNEGDDFIPTLKPTNYKFVETFDISSDYNIPTTKAIMEMFYWHTLE